MAKNFESKNFKFFFKFLAFFIFVYSKINILLEKFCLLAKVAEFFVPIYFFKSWVNNLADIKTPEFDSLMVKIHFLVNTNTQKCP